MSVRSQAIHPRGPELSRLVWGLMRILESDETRDPARLAGLIDACLDLGITTFDHADIYGGYRVEEHFGRALKAWGGDRGRIQLVTKCSIMLVTDTRAHHRLKHYDTSRAHIAASIDRSLANFGTDYIDLLLIHRPDPLMDADEVAEALQQAVQAGKIRHAGVSNHSPGQFDLLQSRLDRPLVTNQIELSVLQLKHLYDGTLDHAQRVRAAPMIWSPLGGAALFRGDGERELWVRGALERVGRELGGLDAGQTALAWLLTHPSRPVPVLGTGRLERLRAFARAEPVRLDRQQWFSILEASQGHEVL